MTQHDAAASPAASRRKRARAGLAVLGVLAVGGVGASALWSDTAQVETTVTSGSFDINVDGDQGNPVPYPIPVDLSNVVPGDRVDASITINNAGTTPADLGIVYMGGPNRPIADAMRLEVEADRAFEQFSADGAPLKNISLAVGTNAGTPSLGAGESITLDLTFVAPEDFPSGLQGTSERMVFLIGATQATS